MLVERLAHRVGPALLEAGDPLVLHDLELALRQGRLAEDLAEDLQHGGQVGALGLDREGDRPRPTRRRPASHPAHAAVPSRAKFLSSASWICWRVRFLVPRSISPERKPAASTMPLRLSAVP